MLMGITRVGVFSTLTNSYALVAIGASENFYRYEGNFPRRTATRGSDDLR